LTKYEPRKTQGREISTDPYFKLMADADGVGFIEVGDGVLVVPLTPEEEVLMVMERAPAFDSETLTLPGGEVEEGESLEECANRELQEELGWRAEKLDFVAELRPFSKYMTSRQFVFLARGLSPSKLEGDETHPVRPRTVALDSFHELCFGGELHDATAIAALFLVRTYLEQE
jgi:ADP-ribose diphosphatase